MTDVLCPSALASTHPTLTQNCAITSLAIAWPHACNLMTNASVKDTKAFYPNESSTLMNCDSLRLTALKDNTLA